MVSMGRSQKKLSVTKRKATMMHGNACAKHQLLSPNQEDIIVKWCVVEFSRNSTKVLLHTAVYPHFLYCIDCLSIALRQCAPEMGCRTV